MVAGCGMTCIKYTVFVVNFLFFVLGVAAVGLGIWALVDKNDMEALTKIDSDGKLTDFNAIGLLQSGAIVLIVGGSFLIIMGFMGCCGAVKEIKCLLAVYAGVVILIIIIEIAAFIVAAVFRNRIEDKLEEGLVNGIKEHYDGNLTSDDAFSRAFDFAQIYFECCGVNSTKDFEGSPWKKANPGKEVPGTCCKQNNRDKFFDDNELDPVNKRCTSTAVGSGNPYSDSPCLKKIKDWVVGKAAIIIGIAVGIVVIEIVAVIFAICLYRHIED